MDSKTIPILGIVDRMNEALEQATARGPFGGGLASAGPKKAAS